MNTRKALGKCFLSTSSLWWDFLEETENLNILYYPSAGLDMMPFTMSGDLPNEDIVFKTPNLFIYTDYFVFNDTSFLNDGRFTSNKYVDVRILDFCRLTTNTDNYQLNFNQDYLDFDLGINTGNILFMRVRVTNRLGDSFDSYLLYLMHENINFIEQFLLKFDINVNAIMWKRDGTGLGGGRLYHSFILQLLNKLKTKWLFVWDFYLNGQELELDSKNFTIEPIPHEVLPYIKTNWSIKARKVRDFEYPNEDKINFYKLENSSLSNNPQKPESQKMKNYKEEDRVIKNYLKALSRLRELKIAPNSKDFTSQIGEWLVEQVYEGVRAESGIQKCWDVAVGNTKIQVKTHAKASTTNARWSAIDYNPDADVDKLVIIVFSQDYKLKEFYSIDWKDALPLIKKERKRDVIYWNHIKNHKVEINKLPKQDLVSIFN